MAKKFIFPILIIICIIGVGIYLMNRPSTEETSKKKTPEETISPSPEEQLPEGNLEGEVVDQMTADLKGEGKQQLVHLVAIQDKEHEFVYHDGLLRIFKDTEDKVLEWEAPLVEGVHSAGGSLIIAENPATNRKTIQATWGVGAHGSISQFVHWTGYKFEEIKAIDENNQEIVGAFFGDGGGATLMPDGRIWVALRNYNCPFDQSITYKYRWDGTTYKLYETDSPPCPQE